MIPVSKLSETADFSNLPSLPAMSGFLERALPGRSTSIQRVRQQILEFSASPTARAVLLRGPIGAGKSTIARLIALMKRVAPLTSMRAKEMLDLVRFEASNQTSLLQYVASWYVELSLTGLVETLAEAQLFGVAEKAATDAAERMGVFEAASRGRIPPGKEETIGARVTGGVVFLDEIGDLPEKLQPKLLPVLSGSVFYRVGDEGKKGADLHFHGVTIAASWKELDSNRLRPDLLSRIAAYTIDVPGVDDRIEDFDALLDGIEIPLIDGVRRTMEKLSAADPDVDRAYLRSRIEALRPMKRAARDDLRQVAWGSRGNLRGLTAAVERILTIGADPKTVIANLPSVQQADLQSRNNDLLGRLLARARTGDGLAAHLRAVEREERRALREKLQGDRISFARVVEALGIDESKLRAQLRHIDRKRRSGEDDR
jgi:DNA-binding NtrC family response regulator